MCARVNSVSPELFCMLSNSSAITQRRDGIYISLLKGGIFIDTADVKAIQGVTSVAILGGNVTRLL
jgi:hypothetical protein